MFGFVQTFVRGCFVAPELEEKAIRLADEATLAASEARATAVEAQKLLRKGNTTANLLIGVGIGIGLTALAAANKDRLEEYFQKELAGKN